MISKVTADFFFKIFSAIFAIPVAAPSPLAITESAWNVCGTNLKCDDPRFEIKMSRRDGKAYFFFRNLVRVDDLPEFRFVTTCNKEVIVHFFRWFDGAVKPSSIPPGSVYAPEAFDLPENAREYLLQIRN